MEKGRTIELLSPAKNLECGIEAIKHGADAVYIGAGRFGARQAAGNPVDDIVELTRFAHFYGAKVYVTVNTILKDSELQDAEKLIWQLYEAGVDALLVQDMAVLRMNLPPIALHASTQCDIRNVEKVRFLADCGFTRVVLARELSLAEITDIHKACPDVELECFVHGALCVSYSGQCYASQYCFGRSANRGECAQFCRLKFDLVDAYDNVLIRGKHLLSLRDMNRMDYLEELMDAGVCSFKIEGRLKDVSYVKNITAAYNQALESVLRHRDDFKRASAGTSVPYFSPDVSKSFNRGFSDYFLHGRSDDICSFSSPKAIGEKMGVLKEVGRGWLNVAGSKAFHNGDGLCFLNAEGELEGYRVNRVENGRVFLFLEGGDMPQIKAGTVVYRNFDKEFDKTLSKESASRKIGINILFEETDQGFKARFTDEDGFVAETEKEWKKEDARMPQESNIKTQLSKLGATRFEAHCIEVRMDGERFIPSSLLSEMRRSVTEKLEILRFDSYTRPVPGIVKDASFKYPENSLTYLGNVLNSEARNFYSDHGVVSIDDAFEKTQPEKATIMYCRHCIKYTIGLCPKRCKVSKNLQIREPLYLRSSDGCHFGLNFDCSRCQMEVRK
ncbi:MAG: U32 family peptidase [Bacteroidaceae bacterium]|nr:U32 family peptidase [Bacteroidaceae bacterium]